MILLPLLLPPPSPFSPPPIFQVVLLTEKAGTTSLYKALSMQLHRGMDFAQVGATRNTGLQKQLLTLLPCNAPQGLRHMNAALLPRECGCMHVCCCCCCTRDSLHTVGHRMSGCVRTLPQRAPAPYASADQRSRSQLGNAYMSLCCDVL